MSGPFAVSDADKLARVAPPANGRVISPLSEREAVAKKPKDFTPVERSLIRKVHGYMPAQQLLAVLNERLAADIPGSAPHTMAQLHAEVGAIEVKPAGDHDWSSLRKLVAKARRDGVLDTITTELIDDFAVVFQLSSAQVLRLQDVLLSAKDGGDE